MLPYTCMEAAHYAKLWVHRFWDRCVFCTFHSLKLWSWFLMSLMMGWMVESATNFEWEIACITCLESPSMMIFVRFLLVVSWISISATEASPTFGLVMWMKSICTKSGIPLSDLHIDAIVLPLFLIATSNESE